ncbi:hypothetical protein B0H14DRAFT_3783484 [Mycena olivaceomarginata]|nr:hypothetical protein B0H14DRAFT_3783484 [Mycena olivaceomarginata]
MDANVGIAQVNPKPITASLLAPMRHLRSVGSCFARWRGLGISTSSPSRSVGSFSTHPASPSTHAAQPHMLAVPASATLLAFFVFLPASSTLTRVEAVLLPWTCSSSFPSTPRLLPPRLLSHVLFTAAWRSFNRPCVPLRRVVDATQLDDFLALALHILAVPTNATLVTFCVFLPASATLTCIEAALAHCRFNELGGGAIASSHVGLGTGGKCSLARYR